MTHLAFTNAGLLKTKPLVAILTVVVPLCFQYFSNHKIPVKTQLYNINYALQLHVSTRRSHHQAIFGTI